MEFEPGEKDPKDGQILSQEKQLTVSPLHADILPEEEAPAERIRDDQLVAMPFVEAENTSNPAQLEAPTGDISNVATPSHASFLRDDETSFHWGAALSAAAVCLIAGAILIFVWIHQQ